MGKIIAFANQKGGVGKTTTCLNVSAYMALMGKKVLLIDIDPQGNATSGLGQEKSNEHNSIYQVISKDCEVDEAVIKTNVDNLDLLPANIDLAGVEVELVYKQNREKIFKEILDKIKNSYDYITIDCPPSLGLITVNALTAADSVCIPMQCEFFSLEGLSQLMNTIRLIKKRGLNPDLQIEGVVLTMRDTRSNLGKQVAEEINKFFGNAVFKTNIPRNVRLAESPSYGMPVYLYDKSCSGAQAYLKLTEEILNKNNDKFNKINTKGKRV